MVMWVVMQKPLMTSMLMTACIENAACVGRAMTCVYWWHDALKKVAGGGREMTCVCWWPRVSSQWRGALKSAACGRQEMTCVCLFAVLMPTSQDLPIVSLSFSPFMVESCVLHSLVLSSDLSSSLFSLFQTTYNFFSCHYLFSVFFSVHRMSSFVCLSVYA